MGEFNFTESGNGGVNWEQLMDQRMRELRVSTGALTGDAAPADRAAYDKRMQAAYDQRMRLRRPEEARAKGGQPGGQEERTRWLEAQVEERIRWLEAQVQALGLVVRGMQRPTLNPDGKILCTCSERLADLERTRKIACEDHADLRQDHQTLAASVTALRSALAREGDERHVLAMRHNALQAQVRLSMTATCDSMLQALDSTPEVSAKPTRHRWHLFWAAALTVTLMIGGFCGMLITGGVL